MSDLAERVARLEARVDDIEDDISDLRAEIRDLRKEVDSVHGRINDILTNELPHLRRGKVFWLKILLSSTVISTLITQLPHIIRALRGG